MVYGVVQKRKIENQSRQCRWGSGQCQLGLEGVNDSFNTAKLFYGTYGLWQYDLQMMSFRLNLLGVVEDHAIDFLQQIRLEMMS